jgi:tetratricopeptide (TPR) repeat protein
LDPLSLGIHTALGHVLYLSRRYDEAIAQYRRALELDPAFAQAHLWFGRPYLEKGMFDAAIAEVETAVRLSHESTMSLAVLGHAHASAGHVRDAKAILARLRRRGRSEYVPSYWIALVHTGLGDKARAISWLERAERERSAWLAWIKVEPRFDRLRSEARFSRLLRRLKLA